MIVKHIGIVEIVKDKRGKHEYIYDIFDYDDTNCSMFFTYYKYLFNMDLDYPKIRITLILIEKMMNIEIIYDK